MITGILRGKNQVYTKKYVDSDTKSSNYNSEVGNLEISSNNLVNLIYWFVSVRIRIKYLKGMRFAPQFQRTKAFTTGTS